MLFGAALLAFGCSRPTPPRITPRSAEVIGANSQGLGLRIHYALPAPPRRWRLPQRLQQWHPYLPLPLILHLHLPHHNHNHHPHPTACRFDLDSLLCALGS